VGKREPWKGGSKDPSGIEGQCLKAGRREGVRETGRQPWEARQRRERTSASYYSDILFSYTSWPISLPHLSHFGDHIKDFTSC